MSAFVYRWQKKTSATGYLRFGPEMNRRVQDGLKMHFLCPTCEDLLNVGETHFAANVFHPFTSNELHSTQFSPEDLAFAVGQSWRVLAYVQTQGIKNLRGRHPGSLDSARETWKGYLDGSVTELRGHDIHLIPFSGVREGHGPPNMNRYLRRTVEIGFVVSNSIAFTYAKLGPLMLVGLVACANPNEWENTRIEPNGAFGPGDVRVPGEFINYVISRAERLAALEATLSPTQIANIERGFERDPARALSSETLKAAIYDIQRTTK